MNRMSLALLILGLLTAQVQADPGDKPAPAATTPRGSAPPRQATVAQGSGQPNAPMNLDQPAQEASAAPVQAKGDAASLAINPTSDDFKSLRNVFLIGLVSLAPAAILMFTSFVRINIVLMLLRQALGSPQVPGNQVLMALALLLTVIVMGPTANAVYTRAIEPYSRSQHTAEDVRLAWEAGSQPIKKFMIDQIDRTRHTHYLATLYDIAEPPRSGRFEPEYCDQYPLRVVAPAFLLSELTTALMIGFLIYLPFLVIDLVVSAVLSAMGLFMLPPTTVAMPLKLVLFVLADGWVLVASALLRTFVF